MLLSLPLENLLIIAFATYRLTLLFSKEAGPLDMFGWIRFKLGVRHDEHSRETATGFWSELILCPYCFSVWVGIVLTVYWLVAGDIALITMLPFTLSGVVVFCFKWAGV